MSTERDRQRERTRARLVEAALQVFRRDGVDAARVDDIARIAEVSRGTFYFHFPTKDDVLIERLAASQDRIGADLDALPDDTPIEAVLRLTAGRIAAEWSEDPALLREVGMVALRLTAQDLGGAIDQHPVQRALIPRFEGAVARGELDDLIPAGLLGEFFLVNLFGAALAWCSAPLAPLDLILDQVVTFFLRGGQPETIGAG